MENLIERLLAYAAGMPSADAASAGDVSSRTRVAAFLRTAVPELFGAVVASSGAAWGAAGMPVKAVAAHAGASLRLPPDQAESDATGQPLKSSQDEAAWREIQRVLNACDGDKAEAARRLGVSRTTLWRKLKAHGL